MKYLFSFIVMLIGSTMSFAGTNEVSFTQPAYEFTDLDKIESFIEKNPGITLEEMKAGQNSLLSGIELTEDTASTLNVAKEMPIVGGFWWGCCLGIVGLALVYFITDNDKTEVKNALIGCVISTILVGVGGLLDPFGWF